jgi:hypothetical protein
MRGSMGRAPDPMHAPDKHERPESAAPQLLLSQSGSKQSGKPSQSSSLPSEQFASEVPLALQAGPVGWPEPAALDPALPLLDAPAVPLFEEPALALFVVDLASGEQPPNVASARTKNAGREWAIFIVLGSYN